MTHPSRSPGTRAIRFPAPGPRGLGRSVLGDLDARARELGQDGVSDRALRPGRARHLAQPDEAIQHPLMAQPRPQAMSLASGLIRLVANERIAAISI